jgi:hypothetical protein
MRFFSASLIALLISTFHAFCQTDEFALVKSEDDIFIYERWITFPKSDPPVNAREVKGEFHFNNTIDQAVRLLQDEKLIQKWQDHVSDFKVFKLPDTTRWYEYSYHDIPWPVSDQDHLLIYKIESFENGELFITFETVTDEKMAPIKRGVTRMKLSGSWTFANAGPSRVKATYRILSMPMNIPKFLTDPIIRNNMMTTIQEFIALMEQKP